MESSLGGLRWTPLLLPLCPNAYHLSTVTLPHLPPCRDAVSKAFGIATLIVFGGAAVGVGLGMNAAGITKVGVVPLAFPAHSFQCPYSTVHFYSTMQYSARILSPNCCWSLLSDVAAASVSATRPLYGFSALLVSLQIEEIPVKGKEFLEPRISAFKGQFEPLKQRVSAPGPGGL